MQTGYLCIESSALEQLSFGHVFARGSTEYAIPLLTLEAHGPAETIYARYSSSVLGWTEHHGDTSAV
jgi:hypothetical protein